MLAADLPTEDLVTVERDASGYRHHGGHAPGGRRCGHTAGGDSDDTSEFERHGVKRLLVREGLTVHGIESVTDLAHARGDIHRELVRSMDRRRGWEC